MSDQSPRNIDAVTLRFGVDFGSNGGWTAQAGFTISTTPTFHVQFPNFNNIQYQFTDSTFKPTVTLTEFSYALV